MDISVKVFVLHVGGGVPKGEKGGGGGTSSKKPSSSITSWGGSADSLRSPSVALLPCTCVMAVRMADFLTGSMETSTSTPNTSCLPQQLTHVSRPSNKSL